MVESFLNGDFSFLEDVVGDTFVCILPVGEIDGFLKVVGPAD